MYFPSIFHVQNLIILYILGLLLILENLKLTLLNTSNPQCNLHNRFFHVAASSKAKIPSKTNNPSPQRIQFAARCSDCTSRSRRTYRAGAANEWTSEREGDKDRASSSSSRSIISRGSSNRAESIRDRKRPRREEGGEEEAEKRVLPDTVGKRRKREQIWIYMYIYTYRRRRGCVGLYEPDGEMNGVEAEYVELFLGVRARMLIYTLICVCVSAC